MEDEKIIALFWNRDERALHETKTKYGRYCRKIALNILRDGEDAKECENDTYLDAWRAMPPMRPFSLSAFLGALTRRIAIDRFRRQTAEKRNMQNTCSLSELEECVPDAKNIDDAIAASELAACISAFLRTLPEAESNVFVRRYWHCESIAHIAFRYGFGESKVKMMLKRTREKLLTELTKEGIFI